MATITLTFPDGVQTRVVDALCDRGGWNQNLGPRGAFAKGVVIDWVHTVVKHYEGEQAATTARSTAESNAESQITIT